MSIRFVLLFILSSLLLTAQSDRMADVVVQTPDRITVQAGGTLWYPVHFQTPTIRVWDRVNLSLRYSQQHLQFQGVAMTPTDQALKDAPVIAQPVEGLTPAMQPRWDPVWHQNQSAGRVQVILHTPSWPDTTAQVQAYVAFKVFSSAFAIPGVPQIILTEYFVNADPPEHPRDTTRIAITD